MGALSKGGHYPRVATIQGWPHSRTLKALSKRGGGEEGGGGRSGAEGGQPAWTSYPKLTIYHVRHLTNWAPEPILGGRDLLGKDGHTREPETSVKNQVKALFKGSRVHYPRVATIQGWPHSRTLNINRKLSEGTIQGVKGPLSKGAHTPEP